MWISEYTLWLWMGVGLALCWLVWAAPRYGIPYRQWSVWAPVAVIAAVLVGRAGYVLLHSMYFTQNPEMVWRLRDAPGVYGTSAAVGALLVGVVWIQRVPHYAAAFLRLFGPACLFVAVGAWLGSLSVGCAWGQEVTRTALPVWARWSVARLSDVYHIAADRYAVQAIGAGWALFLAVFGAMAPRPGIWVFSLYLVGQAGLGLLRGDSVTEVAGARSDVLLDLALAGGWAVLVALWGCRPVSHSQTEI